MKLVEPAIHALIVGLAAGQVFAMRAPDKAAGPFIIFQRTDSERWRAINGPAGIAQAYIQIDAYENEYYAAKELGAAIETILDGYRGTVYHGTDSPQESVEICGVTLQNDLDIFDQTDEPFLFRCSATYLVTYKQED
jgi:hypothetical protein